MTTQDITNFLAQTAMLRDFLESAHDPDLLPIIRRAELGLVAQEILRLQPLAADVAGQAADPVPVQAQSKCVA